jgi:hypothetical protein
MGNLCWAIPAPLEKERSPADSRITQRRSSRPSTALLPWSPSTGTGGRHPPETVVAFNRKPWSPWTGARTQHCDCVYAVIDTASKTGTEHDATAVTYFAFNRFSPIPLVILDWDIIQIEGAILETWLPSVFQRLEELSRACRARSGSIGACIEDKNSGTILLQQAQRRGHQATAIESKLTAMGKDERAISVSGYVHRGNVKYTDHAFNKTSIYKRQSRNHLLDQVESFRIGDKDSNREDDLLDTFCYGIAISLGNGEGF